MAGKRAPRKDRTEKRTIGARRTYMGFPLELTPEEEEAWAEEFVRRLRADAEEPEGKDR